MQTALDNLNESKDVRDLRLFLKAFKQNPIFRKVNIMNEVSQEIAVDAEQAAKALEKLAEDVRQEAPAEASIEVVSDKPVEG